MSNLTRKSVWGLPQRPKGGTPNCDVAEKPTVQVWALMAFFRKCHSRGNTGICQPLPAQWWCFRFLVDRRATLQK